MNESDVSKHVRLLYAQDGGALWRNNVGAFQDQKTGRWVRYGLANDSSVMNSVIKSSDLVGIMPVQITLAMVGSTIGQFVAIETKASDWIWKGTGREWAQQKFLDVVISKGGIGRFSTGE